MILLIHNKAKRLHSVRYKEGGLKAENSDLCEIFWKLAEKYPNEIIAWCEEDYEDTLSLESWSEVFHHDLIMASYAVKSTYIPDAIGYIDQLPFVNVNRRVHYATWRMSADIGGIKGEVVLKFRDLFGNIRDFGLLLNCIAKLGQQNGLFCYSVPGLLKSGLILDSNSECAPQFQTGKRMATASTKDLFAFVYSHYNSLRIWLLLWCFIKYENSFPLLAVLKAIFNQKFFKKNVDLSEIEVKSTKNKATKDCIDVIIPTMGRREYLLKFLEDLKLQTFLPKKVIIVEQNPELGSKSELPELERQNWPFKIQHHFTHQTGACNARNIALREVNADWVFFADDDNEMGHYVLENAMQEIKRLGIQLLTLKYSQKEELLIFDKVKQWGTFGAGNSIVHGKFASQIRFDMAFEHGYGEDKDYGMQLRNAGCDIIYHPNIEILHLKAPLGGFRETSSQPWEKDEPKPSPTMMVYAKKHYSPEQLKGFKTELFMRYYSKQEIKNPLKYLKMMRERWRKSQEWAEKLRRSKEMVENKRKQTVRNTKSKSSL
jgi:glycosyltransferase involved in cell wall biosynthesis